MERRIYKRYKTGKKRGGQRYWVCKRRKYGSFLQPYKPLKHKQQLKRLSEKGELVGPGVTAGAIRAMAGLEEPMPVDKDTQLVVKQGEIMGTLRVHPSRLESERELGIYNIGSVFVKKSERGKGMGSEMIRNVFKNPKIKYISGLSHPSAEGFWKKHGAKFTIKDPKTGEKIFYIKKDEDFPDLTVD